MNLIVFEDAGVPRLSPITLGRPAYAITCASYRLIDWLELFDANVVGLVRPHLELIQLHDFPDLSQTLDRQSAWTVVVNARMVPSRDNYRQLQQLVDRANGSLKKPLLVRNGWAVSAVLLPTDQLPEGESALLQEFVASLGNGSASNCESIEIPFELFEYPHDVVRHNMLCFADNMQQRIDSGAYQRMADGVYVADGKLPEENVTLDASGGPIVIENDVSIGSFALIRGPVYLGAGVKISEHASVKDEVSIAHTCKVGGEVEATVFEAFSNKQHYGFLGHGYVGSWVNLGAGTCNSDLKNTYGLVNMQYDGKKTATGMQFMGCIIGDYAKTAINTSIFTGKQIGVGSMIYGWLTENVPSFVNYARSLGEISLMSADVIEVTQGRMFARRSVDQRACDRQLIHDMFQLTKHDRPGDLADRPPQF